MALLCESLLSQSSFLTLWHQVYAFGDDAKTYRYIATDEDVAIPQKDHGCLHERFARWHHQFHPDKYEVMSITKLRLSNHDIADYYPNNQNYNISTMPSQHCTEEKIWAILLTPTFLNNSNNGYP